MCTLIEEKDIESNIDKKETNGKKFYECHIWICPESEGGFSVMLPFLPGVVSQGETIPEAIENIREAFRGIAEDYKENGEKMPWIKDGNYYYEKPIDVIEKWIVVNV
jgi:antitoxin HicB